MGKGAAGKFIPSAFHAASREWQAAFLDGYFTGDGSARSVGDSTTHRATTVSPHIARGIARMVAAAHRVIASVSTLYPAGSSVICGRAVRVREAYCVSYAEPREGRNRPGAVDELGAWLPVTSVTKTESAEHVVYNFEVEEDHSYVAGGFAVHNCQGFSTAGKREIGDARNQLFREYCRLLEGLRPRAFVMENVSGMVKGDFKIVFAEILRTLKGCGYRVKARLLNAMFFGVPQSRERMIFVGVREDIGREPSHPIGWSEPVSIDAASARVHVRDAEVASLITAAARYANYRRWNELRPGQSLADIGDAGGHSCMKLDPSKPCPAILKKDGDLSARGKMHWFEKRRPTTNEFMRWGSFPDAFRFIGELGESVERIGNSVPPLLMRSIARHVRTIIAH
jgi:DNA (cytosine-5)-methyltransferase 1